MMEQQKAEANTQQRTQIWNPKGVQIIQPRVARNELPWVIAHAISIYPEGVALQ
jgi:hypothetical protein